MDSFCIVIPTYNRKRLLKECLDSIVKQSETALKIIVVVDGSTDGTLELLAEKYPDIEIVNGTGDWWWTKSVNKGIEAAFKYSPDSILLLNDDVVLPRNYLREIIKSANENPGSLIGSAVKDILTGKYTFVGDNLDWKKVRRLDLIKYYGTDNLPEYIPVNNLPGRGLFVPSIVFSQIEPFDERFPQQNSDADFTIRANRAGYGLFVSTRSFLYSHMDEGPDRIYESDYSIANFFKRLYEKRSKQNLFYLCKFNLRHCPKRWSISYSLINIIATVSGYIKRWLLPKENKR